MGEFSYISQNTTAPSTLIIPMTYSGRDYYPNVYASSDNNKTTAFSRYGVDAEGHTVLVTTYVSLSSFTVIDQWVGGSSTYPVNIRVGVSDNVGYSVTTNLIGIYDDNVNYPFPIYDTKDMGLNAAYIWLRGGAYPINYTATGCTLQGATDAAPGQDVVISVTPSQGYAFRGSSGVDIRDNHGERIPFIVNGNQVAFTMPQPY